jgi:hypothetical protein
MEHIEESTRRRRMNKNKNAKFILVGEKEELPAAFDNDEQQQKKNVSVDFHLRFSFVLSIITIVVEILYLIVMCGLYLEYSNVVQFYRHDMVNGGGLISNCFWTQREDNGSYVPDHHHHISSIGGSAIGGSLLIDRRCVLETIEDFSQFATMHHPLFIMNHRYEINWVHKVTEFVIEFVILSKLVRIIINWFVNRMQRQQMKKKNN